MIKQITNYAKNGVSIIMELFNDKKNCCFCAACINVCPKSAIVKIEDEMGSYYPKIDESLCIDCGACKRVCDFQKRDQNQFGKKVLKAYGAASKDDELKKKSASGGLFAQLAKVCLDMNGVVYGAAMLYENKLIVKHIRVDNVKNLDLLQGSKYVQSDMGNVYHKVKEDLIGDKMVLFSGTPCQIAALKSFLKKDYKNLYTIDIICHGVSTQKIFQEYIAFVENKKKINITNFAFRDKEVGWGLDAKYEYESNGKIKTKKLYYKLSSFYTYYEKAIIHKENCYNCKYSCKDRVGDITLGDFWGVEKNQPDCLCENGGIIDERKGVSFCLVNSEQGEKLFDKVSEFLDYVDSDFDTISKQNDNLLKPTEMPLNRQNIMELYRTEGYEAIEKMYWKTIGYKRIYYFILAKAPRTLKKKIRTLLKK